MAPTHRGRKPALPRKFLVDRGWRFTVKEREGGRKDKYWEDMETGRKCRSTVEVKHIMEAEGIYYTEPSTQAKGASCGTTMAKPTPTSPAHTEASEEILNSVAVHVVSEQNSVAPQDITDNNAQRDVELEEGAQEQQHDERTTSFDLNIRLRWVD
ncbi:unnamed protein product [Urochloa decumbens]|uniref:Uncharacterized protein n=1 Tax=Urochloa decumbens TaxID=240449 RepID=A0ABC9H9C7_9POAL